jgi:hypothetical protein
MAMIERLNNKNEDVEALLPWYEKGTLPASESRRVEEYLRENADEGHRFLGLIREEVTETIEANEQAGMPSAAALNRLMEAVEAEPKAKRFAARQRSGGGLFARLFGQGAAPWVPVATLAATLLILVQAAALGVLLLRGPLGSTGTELASGDNPIQKASDGATYVLVRFSPGATAENISTLLRTLHATIVEVPKPGGVYRIRISSKPLENNEQEAILRQIRARSDIISIISAGSNP